MSRTASRALVRVLGARGYHDLPAQTRDRVEAMLPDYLAVASYGSRTDTGRIAHHTAAGLQGSGGTSTVLGSYGQLTADMAAFSNATAAHSLEFDDIDATSFLHYGAPVASAALAIAEREHADGHALVAAVAAGCEVMARLSDAMNPMLRDRGFHTTTALGPFGGALAAAVLLGLDDDAMVNALAFAGAQAGGLMEIYGASMQKRFNPGFAARNGVLAALLAAGGATGEETVLEGPGGFGVAFAGGLDVDRLLDGLGTVERARIEIKPYACVRPIHSALDAIVELRRRHAIDPAMIASIMVARPPAWGAFFWVPAPRSRHEAQVSLPYAVAAVALYGDADPARFDVAAHRDILRLAERVTAVTDPELVDDLSSRVEITLVDDTVYAETRHRPRGSAELPLTEDERRSKVIKLMTSVYGDASTELAEQAFALADAADVTSLLGRLRGAVARGPR